MSSLPNVIHFNCQSCGMLLTVPKEMAGVTGPCPHCRATITSPAAPAQAQLPGPSWPMAENAVTAPAPQATVSVPVAAANPLPGPLPPPAPAPAVPAAPPVSPAYAAQPQPLQQPQPLPQYPPSWPAAGGLAPQSAPVAASPPSPAPEPLPVASTPAPAPAPVSALDLMSQPPSGPPSSSWEAANPPQVSPLPPAVGGGVLNPAWPPAGVELPAPQLPAPPGSAHPVMDSVLQMPSVHQPPFPPFPPVPPPRTSPLTPPGGSAAAQRFKSSRGYSTSRKGPAVLAVLMALMALAGTAWFFRDQLRLAWTTHMAAREAEAEALEFHPSAPAPDESSATPSNTFNPAGDPKGTGKTSTGTGEVATTPPDAPPATVSGAGASTPEQVQRPAMASGSPETPPAPAPTAPEGEPAPAPSPAPATSPGATAPPPQPPAPNLVEVPGPESQNPAMAANPGTAPSTKAVAVPAEPLIADVSPESRPALEVLQQFLTAPTWEDRLKVVQGAELMRPLMQSYYASMPDGPLHVSKIGLIRHDKSPQTGPPHCVFQIGGGDLKRPLPIMVEQTPEGWRVDWLTFTEFKDNLLARFMESPQEGPKRFHVLVRRTHYFDDNVPELDKKICVEVQAPMPPFVGSVFAHKGTTVSNILDRYLGWQVDQAAAVVELEWRREGDQQWVELTNLPQFNWRNAIAGEVVPPPHATPTSPVAVPAK